MSSRLSLKVVTEEEAIPLTIISGRENQTGAYEGIAMDLLQVDERRPSCAPLASFPLSISRKIFGRLRCTLYLSLGADGTRGGHVTSGVSRGILFAITSYQAFFIFFRNNERRPHEGLFGVIDTSPCSLWLPTGGGSRL